MMRMSPVAAANAFAHGVALALAGLAQGPDVAFGVRGGDALDFLPGVVAGVAFDEDQFGARARAPACA